MDTLERSPYLDLPLRNLAHVARDTLALMGYVAMLQTTPNRR